MLRRHMWLAGVVLGAGYVPVAVAQGIPGVPAGALPAATTAAAAVGPVAQPQTLWSFLGCSWDQKEECRRMFCQLPLGQMVGNAGAPLGAITGGLIPNCCPQTPSAQQLADKGAVGAAAAIKADEAAAKERRAAVRYLGTVDCHYWPEAQDALIAALRSDKNECVRFEAALALRNGCCCTKKTIEALIIVLSCSSRDGNPSETSARVHGAARQALDKCLCCFEDMNPAPEQKKQINPEAPPPVNPESKSTGKLEPRKLNETSMKDRPVGMAYYARISEQPMEAIVREGRRVLTATQALAVSYNSGGNSLARLMERSSGAPVTQGYIVQGGQPGKAEIVAAKPTNLWEMLAGRSQPVVVSSVPANSVVVESAPATARVTPQPAAMPTMQATVVPSSTASAASSITSPVPTVIRSAPGTTVTAMPYAAPTMQPPPQMPVSKQTTTVDKVVNPTVAPQQAVPVSTPVSKPVPITQVNTAPAIQPVQVTMPTPPAPQVPVAKPAVVTTPVAKPASPPVVAPPPVAAPTPAVSMQSTIQRIAMGTVQDRVKALDSLTSKQKATPELTAQLVKTVEQESNEQVRCAAMRAMVRTQVPADRAIPVLSQVGMDLDSTVGKEANSALAQINLRLVNE